MPVEGTITTSHKWHGSRMNIPVVQGLSEPYKGTLVPLHTSLFCARKNHEHPCYIRAES